MEGTSNRAAQLYARREYSAILRSNPEYRAKENAKNAERMRMLRKNPAYRNRERKMQALYIKRKRLNAAYEKQISWGIPHKNLKGEIEQLKESENHTVKNEGTNEELAKTKQ